MSRIEVITINEPPQKPNGEALFEIIRGPVSGTRESGRTYMEWRIYVPEDQVDALMKKHREVIRGDLSRAHYEKCIISGMTLEDAFASTAEAARGEDG